jgi:hypothetical protein
MWGFETLAFKFSLLGRTISLPCSKKKGLYPVVEWGVAIYAIEKRVKPNPNLND